MACGAPTTTSRASTAPSGYQAPEVADVGPSVAERHLHHRSHARGAGDGVPRQPVDVRRVAATGRRHTAVPALRLALPRAGEGDRHEPRRPLPVGRRAARPVARRAARGRRRRQRHRGRRALDPSSLFGSPTGDRRASSPGPTSPRCGSTAPTRRRRGWPASRSPTAPQRLEVLEQAPEQTVEVQLAKARAAIDASSFPLAARSVERDPHRQPVGVAGDVAVGTRRAGAVRRRRGRDRVQHRVRPGAGGARAEARARARVRADRRLRARRAAVRGLRRHRRELRRAGGVRSGPDARDAAATSPARSRRSTSSRRRAARTSAARRRRAELLTAPGPGLDELAAAAASIDGIAIDPRERLTLQAQILIAALDSVERNGDQPSTHVGTGGRDRTGPARRRRARVPRAGHAHRDRVERIRLVDAANAVRPRTLV